MKITTLYVYPIKGLRGIEVQQAQIGPQGVRYDRHFMLYEVRQPSGELKKVQLDSHPKCALFEQRITADGASVTVCYHSPPGGNPDSATLAVPLEPDVASLEKITIDLHGSTAGAYSMGANFDEWFSARFGVPVRFVYIGDGKRAVLGNTLPPKQTQSESPAAQLQGGSGGWLSSLTSYVTGSSAQSAAASNKPWITFTDVAPLLVASESSLKDVNARLPEEDRPMPMYKFRPNVVVDGEGEDAWAEDFWAELTIRAEAEKEKKEHKLLLTGNCVRCTSLNVDYKTGKPAVGEMGNVLKKLMKDRRVDTGSKWSPVFGRYAFLSGGQDEHYTLSVGDEVKVTKRNTERTVWDWPGL
ncbi:hypothetical protein QBC35DRAFT_499495 [Podospora australis]|uniref:MOSC domain-containing protein n=1 Tax=Podospora australis TaxID=1536484 RepID=A0AAN6WVU8_9PEZI|nr:hypothetical protein QBC35DRAFT_499495 [Podospora australis]